MNETQMKLINVRDLILQHQNFLSVEQKQEIDLMLASTYWAIECRYMSKIDYEVNKLCTHVNKLLFGE